MLDYVLQDVDMILLMSVNPGFGGQEFIPGMLQKISELKERLFKANSNAIIQVDGGISLKNIRQVTEAGADCLVAGSSVFSTSDPAAMIRLLRDAGSK